MFQQIDWYDAEDCLLRELSLVTFKPPFSEHEQLFSLIPVNSLKFEFITRDFAEPLLKPQTDFASLVALTSKDPCFHDTFLIT